MDVAKQIQHFGGHLPIQGIIDSGFVGLPFGRSWGRVGQGDFKGRALHRGFGDAVGWSIRARAFRRIAGENSPKLFLGLAWSV